MDGGSQGMANWPGNKAPGERWSSQTLPTRGLVLFQGLPEAITMPLSTCSHPVAISQKPDTTSHNSGFLRAEPETLVARANLAYPYALQHRENDALELHERNLADYERVHGPDHPHTLNTRANLASSHRAVGHLGRAIELHERSVADYARVFGPDHTETITARSNLAYAYQLSGDLDRAIPLHRQVLADRERLYGPDHAYTDIARQLLTSAENDSAGHE